MIVLDTDVLSVLMRHEDDRTLVEWLDLQPPESVWTTAVTIFEIHFGMELLARGRRKRQLEEAFSRIVDEDLEGRILAFDREAAREAASLSAERRFAGRTVDFRDIEIAGIVASRQAKLATRNLRHFTDLGIELVDPWARHS